MSEDDIILWQDVLDLVVSGKTSNLVCPFCQKGPIEITQKERVTRLECRSCRRYIEGAMADTIADTVNR